MSGRTVARTRTKAAPARASVTAPISSIDGSHPFKQNCPGAFVEYQARSRKGAEVVYFNFALAEEMGLIAHDHPHTITQALSNQLIDTFAIQIINEYDIINKTPIKKNDVRPNRYMATRYLQLQHPSKTGVTSGDGRSIWNGTYKAKGVTWDVTSCGTGATCLSPATALQKRFFRTGDPEVSYGCGYNDLHDGIANAVFSEILHQNGIKTERTLLVLGFPGELSIVVRAGTNLLRPSHFFNHLRQGRLDRLKNVVDFFIDRQLSNGVWKKDASKNKYDQMLDEVARTFAYASAKFEADYIFCWLDWDGDNILVDGGIIDYGSIRQFGLYHHEYRYDDAERWSTSIKEQKEKARNIVRTFAQLVDYVKTGVRKNLENFNGHPVLKKFDDHFHVATNQMLMERIGFSPETAKWLVSNRRADVKAFHRDFRFFERAKSSRGLKKVPDGITCDALFCMRDFLRELPLLVAKGFVPVEPKIILQIMRSEYATRKETRPTPARNRRLQRIQMIYMRLIASAASHEGIGHDKVLAGVVARSAVINRYERVTGNAILEVGHRILRARRRLSSAQFHKLLESFIAEQILVPEKRHRLKVAATQRNLNETGKKVSRDILGVVREYREGI